MSEWQEQLRQLAGSVDPLHLSRHVPDDDFDGRESAVLIAFADADGELDVLLIRRAEDNSPHSGQPAFPGGAVEPHDRDAVDTAFREAHEETGVRPQDLTVLAVLPRLFLPVSSFAVTPVIAHWHNPTPVYPADPAEVAAVVRVPVRDLVDPMRRVRTRHPSGHVGDAFLVADMTVWGFTAGLLSGILRATGWERPWDTTRVVDIEEHP